MINVFPIILPLIFAVIMLFMWKLPHVQRIINLIGSVSLLIVSIILLVNVIDNGIIVYQLGNWAAPFGISLVSDYLSAVMILISAIIYFTTSVFVLGTPESEQRSPGFFPLLQTLIMGINGSFLTGDLFNLYVWFEVMLMSSFVLLTLGGKKEQLEGGLKYVTINLISSAIFLAAIGLLYSTVGTLNMADAAAKISLIDDNLVNLLAVLFMVAFGIKAAIFPLFFWLPASYHTPFASISAIFAGLLTKVGVYALIRVFSLIFVSDTDFTHYIILILSGLTMLIGVLGAAAQTDFRRILSFHIVSQIGYMIMGLGLFTPLAITGAVFYLIHHIIVKTNLFFMSGYVSLFHGSYNLKKLGGVYKVSPLIGLLFLLPAMSLAGIPPLSGFWAKFTVIKAGIESSQYFIVFVALLVGILTLYSMTKIWNEVFWKNKPETDEEVTITASGNKLFLVAPIAMLALITIFIGVYAEPFYNFAEEASRQILNRNIYIEAVLGNE